MSDRFTLRFVLEFIRELIKYSPLLWLSGLFVGIGIEADESSWMSWLGGPLGLLFLLLWGIAMKRLGAKADNEWGAKPDNEQGNA